MTVPAIPAALRLLAYPTEANRPMIVGGHLVVPWRLFIAKSIMAPTEYADALPGMSAAALSSWLEIFALLLESIEDGSASLLISPMVDMDGFEECILNLERSMHVEATARGLLFHSKAVH